MYIQRVVIIEDRRCQTRRIVQGECDIAMFAARTPRRSGKDQIVHLTATHGFGGCRPHDPANTLQDIRFAAAVWPDNAC